MKRIMIGFVILLVPFFVFCIDYISASQSTDDFTVYHDDQWEYIMSHQKDYPNQLIDLAQRNKETIPFVYHYLYQKNQPIDIDESLDEIPLFLQWDERWGYLEYGDDMMAINGCGPTCLSMVMTYLTKDKQYHPYYIAQYAQKYHYYTQSGTSWALMDEGAKYLGLNVEELPLSESIIKNELELGHPIICSMREGYFTTQGHFIVLTNYRDGLISVHDPNSKEKSLQKYTFSELQYQIKNLWSYRKE